MSIERLTKLCQELADVVRFHELDTVDSMAAELIHQVDALSQSEAEVNIEVGIPEDTESMEEFIETVRQANMVNTTR